MTHLRITQSHGDDLSTPEECGPELFLGAVEENPQVVAVDAVFAADLILVALLEEDQSQQFRVPRLELIEDALHLRLRLAGHQGLFDAERLVRDLIVLESQRPW